MRACKRGQNFSGLFQPSLSEYFNTLNTIRFLTDTFMHVQSLVDCQFCLIARAEPRALNPKGNVTVNISSAPTIKHIVHTP